MASKGKASSQLVKLIVGAGQASPQPPVGPALGSKGVKAIDFAKDFNARTAHYIPGTPIPAVVTVKPDRTYTYVLKSPPSSWLLKQAAGVEKGSQTPSKPVGQVSLKHVFELAKIKQMDDNHKDRELEVIVKQLVSVAKSCGITVVA